MINNKKTQGGGGGGFHSQALKINGSFDPLAVRIRVKKLKANLNHDTLNSKNGTAPAL
jgi:hypothetical protein